MPSEVILPRVDMDMATGKISKWFVSAGAAVTKGQPLFEIETDKAAMEIEAPSTGTIRDLADPSGRDIPVGSVVAWIDAEGEAPAPAPTRPDAVAPSPVPPAREVRRGADPAPLPARAEAGAEPSRPRATPMARRLALEHGLDLTRVRGSGPRGRIQADDVIRDARALDRTADAPAPPPMPVRGEGRPRPEPEVEAAVPGRATVRDLNLVRLREGEGAPLLLLHGFGADTGSWRPMLSGASLQRPVYGLDMPGHGGSPLSAVTSFEALVDAVEDALASAGLTGVQLVGHSLGAGVAAALAARGTLDIRALLLLAPAGLGPQINGAFVRGFLAAASEASLTPWMRELVAEPGTVTPAFVRSTLRAREAAGGASELARLADAVFPDGTQAFSIRADLARLRMPVRIVFGAADRIIPARQVAGLPGSVALHLFPGVGHMPQIEVRDAVLAIIEQMS